MAFRMKRPIIKGTPLHKASIAKAKSDSIVAQTRTQADGSLVSAGQALGKSYIPAAIDFSQDQKAIKIPKSNKDKESGKKGKSVKEKPKTIKVEDPTGKPGATLEGTTKQAVEGTGPETEAGRGYVQPANKNPRVRVMTEQELKDKQKKEKEKNLRITKEEAEKVVSGNDKTIEELQKKEFERLQKEKERKKQEKIDQKEYEDNEILEEDDPDIGDMDYDGNNNGIPDYLEQKKTTVKETKVTPPSERTREQKEDDKIYNDFRTSKYKKKKMIEGGYTPIEGKSPVEMRDDRIYRNALSDGPVRRNMIKGGYTPR